MVPKPNFFRSELMLVPEAEGLCLFRSMTPESRWRLPKRHGNEKEAINRTSPAVDWPQLSFSRDAEINRVNVEPHSHQHEHGPQSRLSIAFGVTNRLGFLPEPIQPGRETDAMSSPNNVGRTDWPHHKARPHPPREMRSTTETLTTLQARKPPSRSLDNLVTQSSGRRTPPRETFFGSLPDSRRTEVMNGNDELRTHGSAHSSSTFASGSSTAEDSSIAMASASRKPAYPLTPQLDTSASSFPSRSTASSRKETTHPSTRSQPPTPIARSNPEASLYKAFRVPSFNPVVHPPNLPRSSSLRKKPPLLQSQLTKSSPSSIIARQSSTTPSGSSSSQRTATCSPIFKGVRLPLPSSSMHRKVEPSPREDALSYRGSKPRSVASTSGSSSDLKSVTPTPRSSCLGSLTPSPTRRSRLSMRRLLGSSSPPNSGPDGRVKCSSEHTEVSPVGSTDLPTTSIGKRCSKSISAKRPSDHVVPHGGRIDSIHLVHSPPSPCLMSSNASKEVLSPDVLLLQDHSLPTLIRDSQPAKSQPDVHSKHEEGGIPARRKKNVLRKRSHPRMLEASQGRSPSPTSHDGRKSAASYNRELRQGKRRHENVPESRLQSAGVASDSLVEILQGTGLMLGPPILLEPRDGGPLSSMDENAGRQGSSSGKSLGLNPKHERKQIASDANGFTPAALIAMEYKAKNMAGSSNQHGSFVFPKPQREGKTERPAGRCRSFKDKSLSRSASMGEIRLAGLDRHPEPMPEDKPRNWAKLRARQSLRLSIVKFPNELDKENLHKTSDNASSKAGGGILKRLMRRFSVSMSRDRRSTHPPAGLPIWSISTPMAFPTVAVEPGGEKRPSLPKRADTPSRARPETPVFARQVRSLPPKSGPEIPPLPKRSLGGHIVSPSALDKTHPVDDMSLEGNWPPGSGLQNLSVSASAASPKTPQEGDWIRSESPDPELTALPLPPRRTPKSSIAPAPLEPQPFSGIEDVNSRSPSIPIFSVENAINSFQAGDSPISNLPYRRQIHTDSSMISAGLKSSNMPTPPIPSVSVSPPSCPDEFWRPPADEANRNSNAYLTFARSSLNVTPSVVFRPGTANTFGGSEVAPTNIRPGTSDSVQSTASILTQRGKIYSSGLRRTSISTSSTETL